MEIIFEIARTVRSIGNIIGRYLGRVLLVCFILFTLLGTIAPAALYYACGVEAPWGVYVFVAFISPPIWIMMADLILIEFKNEWKH